MHRFSVAPMMDWTDRHCRSFHRILTRRTLLYTEMVTTGALIHGPRERLLAFSPGEHPVALQLGGSDPADLARCAVMAEERGYDEVNLNCGCPSDRVQNGRFGACLMAEPELVADCVAAMKAKVRIPVTVKCRIGIDEQDPEASLRRFVDAVAAAGPEVFVVHARKAWLKGLSPKENRDVPPLDYDLVRRVKAERPHLTIVLNGGVKTLDEAKTHLAWADGVMMGRAAYEHPFLLARVDSALFGAADPVASAEEAVAAFLPYVERELAQGAPLIAMTRHILGVFAGRPGARLFRRHLSEQAHKRGAGIEVLREALARVAPAAAEAA
ncbi:MAG: tRNA dihydrouridine(20/20a) synthase DusA [Alphaproteobacteria bacterium]